MIIGSHWFPLVSREVRREVRRGSWAPGLVEFPLQVAHSSKEAQSDAGAEVAKTSPFFAAFFCCDSTQQTSPKMRIYSTS